MHHAASGRRPERADEPARQRPARPAAGTLRTHRRARPAGSARGAGPAAGDTARAGVEYEHPQGNVMTPSNVKATLSFSDGSSPMELPIYKGSIGPDVIDIRKLYAQTGKFTYDPGFLSTASCNSAITYIDGDKGELLYRGYPIEELAVKCDFMDVCHLLLYGELPNRAQKEDFVSRVTKHTMVNEQMQFFMRGFRRDAHPMAVMTGLVGALSAFYPDSMN